MLMIHFPNGRQDYLRVAIFTAAMWSPNIQKGMLITRDSEAQVQQWHVTHSIGCEKSFGWTTQRFNFRRHEIIVGERKHLLRHMLLFRLE